MVDIAALEAEVRLYADQIEAIANVVVGRPRSVARHLNVRANMAAMVIDAAAKELDINVVLHNVSIHPDHIEPDEVDERGHPRPQPGRLHPEHNQGFISAHGDNLERLKAALEAIKAVL